MTELALSAPRTRRAWKVRPSAGREVDGFGICNHPCYGCAHGGVDDGGGAAKRAASNSMRRTR